MLVSMTGYGKGSSSVNGFEANVEIRSVNHRFLDLSIKLPKSFESRENWMRERIRKSIERGRVTVNISVREANGYQVGLQINSKAIKGYKHLLEDLREQAQIQEPVQIEHLLSFSDVFMPEDSDETSEEAWQSVVQALELALDNINSMRQREGKEIENDLQQRLDILSGKVQKIEQLSSTRSEDEFARLKKRLLNLIDIKELDPARLELEVALLADRVDVTEECIRLKSHLTLFRESIAQPEPSGKKLNFLLQEMNREANTIGAKANDAEIAHLVVEIKEEVEKLREQIQNVE